MKIRGHNDFSEGYLAYILRRRFDAGRSIIWQEGYRTAENTTKLDRPDLLFRAFQDMIFLGQIIVEDNDV